MNRVLRKAFAKGHLDAYIGSCPDYSHRDGRYTHEALGDGVPLLTQLHIKNDRRFIKAIDEKGVKVHTKIMIADVEAVDEVFCKRFTDGDKDDFLNRCELSRAATDEAMNEANIEGKSTSFFAEFGAKTFVATQDLYLLALVNKYHQDEDFQNKTLIDIAKRTELYKKMYPEQFNDHSFLVIRTLRTMAQYLTLGRLISERRRPSVIIAHPTTNLSMINARNKIRLSVDDPRVTQPKIPILVMPERIY